MIPLSDLGIEQRNLNEFSDVGIMYAHELAAMTRADIEALDNFGEKALQQCEEALASVGFEHPPWR